MARLRLAAVVALSLAGSACGGRQTTLADDTTVEKTGDATAKVAEGDALWPQREDRAKLEGSLKAWEEAAALDPTRADIQLKLTYGYYFLSYGHLRWTDDEDGMLKAYDKGVVAGERAIKLTSPEFAARIKNGEAWEKAIPTVGPEGIDAMYWYASNLSRWAELEGFTSVLSLKDRVFAIQSRVAELNEKFFFGAPHRYFGAYYTKIPFPGGDLPKSKQHFEKAIELAPAYADTRVMFASYYAVKAGDKPLFEKLLKEVLAMPDDGLPDLIPETKNSKRAAKQLLDNIDDSF